MLLDPGSDDVTEMGSEDDPRYNDRDDELLQNDLHTSHPLYAAR